MLLKNQKMTRPVFTSSCMYKSLGQSSFPACLQILACPTVHIAGTATLLGLLYENLKFNDSFIDRKNYNQCRLYVCKQLKHTYLYSLLPK